MCFSVRPISPRPHLSLYGHFDSEGDEVGEEPFQPVWSEKTTAIGKVRQMLHLFCCSRSIRVYFCDLLFITLQMKAELVKVQITV